jgi:hypothetical protein
MASWPHLSGKLKQCGQFDAVKRLVLEPALRLHQQTGVTKNAARAALLFVRQPGLRLYLDSADLHTELKASLNRNGLKAYVLEGLTTKRAARELETADL